MNIYVVHDRTGNQSKRFDNCVNDARDYAEELARSEGLVMLLVCDENQNIQRRLMYSNYDGWYTRENEIDAIWETLYNQESGKKPDHDFKVGDRVVHLDEDDKCWIATIATISGNTIGLKIVLNNRKTIEKTVTRKDISLSVITQDRDDPRIAHLG